MRTIGEKDAGILQRYSGEERSFGGGAVMHNVIIGTAGHIDHGKTTLIRGADRKRYRPARGRKKERDHH